MKYYLNKSPAFENSSSIKSTKPYYYNDFAELINSFNQFSFTSNAYFSLYDKNGTNIYNIGLTIEQIYSSVKYPNYIILYIK